MNAPEPAAEGVLPTEAEISFVRAILRAEFEPIAAIFEEKYEPPMGEDLARTCATWLPIIRAHTAAAVAAATRELRDRCAKLDFACNALRYDLKIDVAIGNMDTPRIVAAFQEALASLREDKERLASALGFASSCIKSGESWSAVCDRIIGGALTAYALNPSTSPATPAPAVHPCSESHPPPTGGP